MNVTQLRAGAAYDLSDVALVSGSSLIYSPSFDIGHATFPLNTAEDLLQEEVMGRLRRTSVNGGIDFAFTRPIEHLGHLKQPVAPLNLIHAHNYFHFLIEALPSLLWMLDRKMLDPNAIIVSGLLHPNMWAALSFVMGRSPLAVLQLKLMQSVTCDRVLTTQPSAHAAQLVRGGTSDWRYNPERLKALRSRFAPVMAPADQARRKLYVRRVSTVRALTNATEVEAAAQAAGYAIVQPERMGFFEQARLFSQASHVVGATGAWAANLLFVPRDARIDIFYPETARVEKAVWSTMAEALQMQADPVYCPVTLLRPEPFTIQSDFMIPIEVLSDLLRQGA